MKTFDSKAYPSEVIAAVYGCGCAVVNIDASAVAHTLLDTLLSHCMDTDWRIIDITEIGRNPQVTTLKGIQNRKLLVIDQ